MRVTCSQLVANNPILDNGILRSILLPQWNHWSTAPFLETCHEWGIPPFVTGRLWEYVMVSLLMSALPDTRTGVALGVGVANEPVVKTAERIFSRVIATDLWNPEWKVSADEGKTVKAHQIVADGTRLPIRDHSIDALWSVSSIEHFHQTPTLRARIARRIKRTAGSLGIPMSWNRDAALKALIETRRVLTRDGLAIITTEVVIRGRGSEFFGFYEFLWLVAKAGLRLASDRCVVELDSYFLQHVLKHKDIRTWSDPTPHIYLDFEGTVFTPVVFVLTVA